MKISGITELLGLTVYSPGDPAREIGGVIIGDLLSFIMAEAREGWLWITIQVHLNVAAVAVLKEVPFVLIASGRKPEKDLVDRCLAEGITLAGTDMSAFEAAGRLWEAGPKRLT
ncbi:serine kinase [Aminivibrio sp.]|uniref:serine kinase n=1 Tax=Aminivibrio sp. TaxID=1872489 RepID=UPI001A3F6A0E|nr:serine kinase [Aminivibrio sp.]MBL3540508.1 serine kinase [Aminivibrio sp.]MDK2958769.1 hypothetical protein [Synergistaceae bacterium]